MRAALAVWNKAGRANRRVDDLKNSSAVYVHAAVVTRLANPHKRLAFVFMQGDQPEDWLGAIQAAHRFRVDVIPPCSNFRKEKLEKWGVVQTPLPLAMH